MTPEQQKAKELVERFYMFTWTAVKAASNADAKQCALICVDEIDKELSYSFLFNDKRRIFYRNVKQEIQKL